MPTAVDTNVLLPVLRGNAGEVEPLVAFLDRTIQSQGLIKCGPVYAELAAAPGIQIAALDHFLTTGAITLDLDLGRDV